MENLNKKGQIGTNKFGNVKNNSVTLIWLLTSKSPHV